MRLHGVASYILYSGPLTKLKGKLISLFTFITMQQWKLKIMQRLYWTEVPSISVPLKSTLNESVKINVAECQHRSAHVA